MTPSVVLNCVRKAAAAALIIPYWCPCPALSAVEDIFSDVSLVVVIFHINCFCQTRCDQRAHVSCRESSLSGPMMSKLVNLVTNSQFELFLNQAKFSFKASISLIHSETDTVGLCYL